MVLPTDDDAILILHNAHCSKSRATLAILEQRGVRFEQRHYLDDPLSREELEDLARRLERPIREWTRQSERSFAEAGVAEDADEGVWLDAIAANPVLMERPIVVRGRRAVIARPPTNVLELLDG